MLQSEKMFIAEYVIPKRKMPNVNLSNGSYLG